MALVLYRRVEEIPDRIVARSPSPEVSSDSVFDTPSPPADKTQSRKMKRSNFEKGEVETSRNEVAKMAKRIKFLENQNKLMTRNQLKMQREMESLIKKNVTRAAKPAVKMLDEAANKFERVVGDQKRVQCMVNLQHAQYEELRKVVEVTTKNEFIPVILDEQADMLDELKTRVKGIQEYVVAQSTWQLAADKEISFLPTIKENQESLMANVSEIVNYLVDDAKKGKV